MKKPSQKIGEIICIEMIAPKEGKFPIARTESGVVCLIERGTKGFFEYHSSWEAEVVEVKEKCLIIRPISCLMTAAANAFELEKKLKSLKTVNGRIIL